MTDKIETPTDPTFLAPNDEWFRTGNYDKLYPEVNKGGCVEFVKMTMQQYQDELAAERKNHISEEMSPERLQECLDNLSDGVALTNISHESVWEKNALVAQRSEQDAHNVLVTGSSPVEGTTSDKEFLEEISCTIENSITNFWAFDISDAKKLRVIANKLEIYEQCLKGIDSIKSVSTGETSGDFGMSMKLFSAMSQIKKLVRKALEEGEKL